MLFSLILVGILLATISWNTFFRHILNVSKGTSPVSVNYHFTRKCNYACGFCFHTAKTSYILPLDEAKRGLALLSKAGMRKLNFAGGEPFLYPDFMGQLAKYCKETLHLESVSIVTNGSKVKKAWFEKYGEYIDILAVSCDSFDEETNMKIGRGTGAHLRNLTSLREWCDDAGIKFKINTVVNRFNISEDMVGSINAIAPFRWKAFQVLIVPGENDSDSAIRNAERFVVSNEEFESFCKRHEGVEVLVPEPNELMRGSYLILDEYMRFLDEGRGEPGKSILEVGVQEALRNVRWDEEGFVTRGGFYDWTRKGTEHKLTQELDW